MLRDSLEGSGGAGVSAGSGGLGGGVPGERDGIGAVGVEQRGGADGVGAHQRHQAIQCGGELTRSGARAVGERLLRRGEPHRAGAKRERLHHPRGGRASSARRSSPPTDGDR